MADRSSDPRENENDDEESIPSILKASSERIFYGSLEDQERKRLEGIKSREECKMEGEMDGVVVFEVSESSLHAVNESKDDAKVVLGEAKGIKAPAGREKKELEGLEAAVASGNIQRVGPGAETYELSAGSQRQREIQEQKYRELILKRRARSLAVPTNVNAVKERLRELGQPVTLFGEREMERRDRLREVLVKMEASGDLDRIIEAKLEAAGAELEEEEEEDEGLRLETFYTEGSAELLIARSEIAGFSLPRAKERISRAKRRREAVDEDEEEELEEVLKVMGGVRMQCSEIGDERPVSGCSFSPDASMLGTCGWSGVGKLWKLPEVGKSGVLKGHTERITDIAFHPRSSLDLDPTVGNVATASADRTALLWSLEGKPLQSFKGHLDRLARLAFHPSGRFLGTASFDKTWRLWDVATGTEILLQEGHSRSVYGIAFHNDGSLAASAGLDALSRVWDLRTGRSILTLEGHVKPILGVDFSPNGYHLATASEDHTCRIWDLRKKACLYIIPAHSSLVSQVKFEPRDGHFLVTASYDNTARIWSGGDFKPVKTLAGHEGKVMGVDVAPDGQYITTVSYDRTVKLWAAESKAMDETR